MAWQDGLIEGTPAHSIASSTNSRIRVIAGPGTGKSFAMKRRVARLLEEGADPRSVLPVTFTRVAAEDLHRELVSLGVPGCEQIEGRTLHSLGMKILGRNHVLSATGRTPRPLNIFEVEPLLYDLASDNGGKRKCKKKIKAFEAAWARLQHEQVGYAPTQEDEAFERDLGTWLGFHEGMLIGEIIPYLYQYLRDNPAAQERGEFAHVLVDEYQDLNKAEQSVIDLLSGGGDVCIVGDDDQSIYSFKHAHPEGIREWIDQHAHADDYGLDECRRSPRLVVAIANALIAHNTSREPRALSPMEENGEGEVRILQYLTLEEEANGITQMVAEMVNDGIPPGDILILAQRRVIGNPIYDGLLEKEVPVQSYYAEQEFDSRDAQYQIALLKLLVNPDDRIALRWLVGCSHNTFHASAYTRVRSYCQEHGLTPWQVLEQLGNGTARIPNTNHLIARFKEIETELEERRKHDDLPSLVDVLFPADPDRPSQLREVVLRALDDSLTPEDLLENILAAVTQPEIPMEIEDVRIMSIHKSKGLSSPVVIMAGCIEGLLPAEPDDGMSIAERNAYIEEQRRLFFVGLTRVKASPENGKPGTLILTNSRRMSQAEALGAGIKPAFIRKGIASLNASRFLAELGSDAPAPAAG